MRTLISLCLGALAVAACAEAPTGVTAPDTPLQPALASAIRGPCPGPATVVVTDEAALHAAVAAAAPGAVIAIDGTITLATGFVHFQTGDVTLTCATRGSGLAADAAAALGYLIVVAAPRVTVSNLVLDGRNVNQPYYSNNNGVTALGSEPRLLDNAMYCGSDLCAFLVNGTSAAVAGNYFEAASGVTGVHLQGPASDDARVERNALVATAPIASPAFGAIRVRDGDRMVVAHNTITGPWRNGMATASAFQLLIEKNSVGGAREFGLRLSTNAPIPTAGAVIRNNQFTGAGSAGIFARLLCSALFEGNNLNGNAGNTGLIFDVPTGANTVVGNTNVVIDNGAFDCDGDGVNDPNIIGGKGAVLHGVNLGSLVSEWVTGSNVLR